MIVIMLMLLIMIIIEPHQAITMTPRQSQTAVTPRS